MQEKVIHRNDEEVIQVRSDSGKLLYIKTKEGYEMKCPRSKKICLIKYEQMLEDCFKCLVEGAEEKHYSFDGKKLIDFFKKFKK